MLVLGISGGPFRTYEDGTRYISPFQFHDASAVLVRDGEIIAACEVERLNRIKHSNKFPVEAIRFCLKDVGIELRDVDYLAYYAEESQIDSAVRQWNQQRALEETEFQAFGDGRHMLQQLLTEEFQFEFPVNRITFVNHHYAHALSAFMPSGFERSLVVTLDAQGDNESGRVMVGETNSMNLLKSFPTSQTLGGAYVSLIRPLGFKQFDEYKAMGLAPHGDPSRFRGLFQDFFELLPEGDYRLNWPEIGRFLEKTPPRRQGQECSREHMDLAAGLQEMLESIVLHVLSHYRKVTNEKNLCFSGGVAHNCSLNGKILRSGLFDSVFVQPAAHDAGCAYGAALAVHRKQGWTVSKPLSHLYWGSDIGGQPDIDQAVRLWKEFVSVEQPDDIFQTTAELLFGGAVIGWVQGRSEFGPRALGNRSILADPRPASNKDRINAMVKKREAFRPFAPAVLEEKVDKFFDVAGASANFDHMIFVVRVRPEHQSTLGATTHVDGTARIQTVSKTTNPRFWQLIQSFENLSGMPVLLNTSFNNNAEPIVDSVRDAMVCFLTTKLDFLVIGNSLIRKRDVDPAIWLNLIPSLPRYAMLTKTRKLDAEGDPVTLLEMRTNYDRNFRREISPCLFEALSNSDGKMTLGELLEQKNSHAIEEVLELWSRRLIVLEPHMERMAIGEDRSLIHGYVARV